jgi:hypothetical protein
MAGLPTTDTRTLNTMVTNALETYTGDPANLVDQGGFKVFKMLADAGRIFAVNDGERVQHPVMFGADGESTTRFVGDDYAGAATNNLGTAQNEVLTKALFTMRNVTKNFNVPQTIMGRPAINAITDVQALTKRNLMNMLAEEEFYFLRGVGTATGTEAELSPFSGDTGYDAEKGSMSLLGLMSVGKNTATQKFANIDTQDAGDGDSDWAPQLYQATDVNPTTAAELDLFLGDWESSIRKASRFGGIERPTHGLVSEEISDRLVTALRDKSTINDQVVIDMGGQDVIPFRGINIHWSQYLEKDTLWDITAETTAEHPALLLNLNSLRLNLVYGGEVSQGGGFVKRISDFAPHPTEPKFFSRLEYKYCFSLDNGRRSFAQIEGWTI